MYLNTEGNQADTLDEHAFRFVAQYRWWENAADYQASYQGSSVGWQLVSVPITSTTFYQGDLPNNNSDDRGWNAIFEIPFTSLVLTAAPQEGSLWGLGLALHDRDDEAGTPIVEQTWLPGMHSSDPSTWGKIHFALPDFTPPQATNLQTVRIRHKLNGELVQDANVGGDTTCGEPFNPDFFNGWGDANYASTVAVAPVMMAVAVNVLGDPDAPATDAVTVFRPACYPRVSRALAVPSAPVVVPTEDSVPPPAVTVHLTALPATG